MSGNRDNEGLMQKSVKLLKEKLENHTNLVNYSMKMTYLEVYNENIRDLFA